MPAASTLMRTSPEPGVGTGRSTGTSTSGPPVPLATMAIIACGSTILLLHCHARKRASLTPVLAKQTRASVYWIAGSSPAMMWGVKEDADEMLRCTHGPRRPRAEEAKELRARPGLDQALGRRAQGARRRPQSRDR